MSRKITGTVLTRGTTSDNINFENQEEIEYTITMKEAQEDGKVVYDPVLKILGKEFYKCGIEAIFEDMEYLEGKDD